MKTLTLKQISNTDNPALTSVIDYWKDYDPKTVLRAYAEIKRRNNSVPERLTKRQNEFCVKYNYSNIDAFLNDYLKENGYNSYEEYFDKEVTLQKKTEAENILKNSDQSSNSYDKYPALRIISGIYKIFAWIIGIVTIIVAVMSLNTGEMGLIFSLISVVVGGLIILGVLAVAESIMVFIDIEHNTRQKEK